jgi:hypothetical protein
MSTPQQELIRYSNQYDFSGEPEVGTGSPTGVVLGPLAVGRWILHSRIECYFARGSSTLAVGSVKVDESATPDTSMPIAANAYIPIDVTGSTNNYVAFKSKSGGSTGLVFAMPQALLSNL